MVRMRMSVEVKYGLFREHLSLWEEISEVCHNRGWAVPTYWVPTVGKGNYFVAEVEYPSLAKYEEENNAAFTDPEFMKLFRKSSEYVIQGTSYTELFEGAPHIA